MLPIGSHTKPQWTRTHNETSSILRNKTGHKMVYSSLSMMLALLVGVVPQTQADHHLAGSLQFTQPEYKISENAGSVTVQVERRGGSQGSVAINYATTGLTAIPDKDYQPVYGGLMWGNGEVSSKPFTIVILDDGEVDAVKEVSFFVSLLDAMPSMTTATARPMLEQNTRAKIVIVDNDVEPPPPTPTTPPVTDDPNTPPTTTPPTPPVDPTRPSSLSELFCAGLNLPSALERGIGKRICTKNPFKPSLRKGLTQDQALETLLAHYTPEQFSADFSDCEPTSATETGLFDDGRLHVILMQDDAYCRIDICPTLRPNIQDLVPVEEVACGVVVSKGNRQFMVNPIVETCDVPDKNCSDDLDGDGVKDCVVCAGGEQQVGYGIE